MLADAFCGHGTFIYLAAETLSRYGNSPDRVVQALKKAGMSHAWIRLHDHDLKPEPETPTQKLVDALRAAGIALAGWGFDRGAAPEREAEVAANLVRKYALTHYVADIEQDEHDSKWTTTRISQFLKKLRSSLPGGAQIFVSSYPYITAKHPDLMRVAAPLADGFAPQIYWHDYPAGYMLEPGRLPPHPSRPYDRQRDQHSPAAYADLCLDWWRDTVGNKPLILTGQAYWENKFTQHAAETKLVRFLATFDGWSRLTAVNWWHLASAKNTPSDGAMTMAMFDAIVSAELKKKPFAMN